jgi:hypothetical protein
VPRQPTPEEELILLLCGTVERRRRAAERIEELARGADYEALAALMARQLLLPLLGERLLATAPDWAPPRFRALLSEAATAARRRGAVMEMLGAQLLDDLEAAGIAALPLKGATLARDLYGDPGLRLAKDIDLLVDPAELDAATAVLRRRGYRPAPRRADGELPRLHLILEHERGELPEIEVHWRVHWYEEEFSRTMLRRSQPAPYGGLRPQPADELASLLIYFSRDGLTGLRLATDAAAWWDRHGGAVERPLLDSIVREAPQLRAALSAAATALERLVGTPAAAMISAAERSRSRRALTAIRLANWTVTGDWDQINANLSLVDLLLSPRGGTGSFVRRSLLPPASEVAAMYRLPPSSVGQLLVWRVVHGPKLILRYLIALWQVRGGREWVALPAGARCGSAKASLAPS